MRPAERLFSSAPPLLVAILIVAAGLAAYANSFRGVFVFDDFPAIRDNATIRTLWPPRAVFSPPANSGVGGRPLANLSFALTHALGGGTPAAHHAGNLLLHLVSGLLLFGIIRRTWRTGGNLLAGAAALLWVVHPATTAAVTYLSQRTEVLMATCYLLTLYAAIRFHETSHRGWGALAVVACALGMMSKEVMVTAPLFVLLYDRTFLAGSFRAAWQRRYTWYLTLAAPWLLLGLLLTTDLRQRSVGFGLGVSPLRYAATECGAILLYLKLSFWPAPLVFDYGAIYPTQAAAVLAVAGLAAAAGVALRWYPKLGFTVAGSFLLLAPTSSFVPVAEQPMAENRLYLPLALVITAAVVAGRAALGPRARGPALAALATACVLLTRARNTDYESEAGLWIDTVRQRPQNPRAHYNAGVALLDAGRAAEAVPYFTEAIRLKPSEPKAHHSLGNAWLDLGRPGDALPHFAEAIRRQPGYARAWYNQGTALLRMGDARGARASLTEAIRLDPSLAEAHTALGNADFQLDRPADALTHYEAALRLDPTVADAHYNAGSAALELGRLDEAITHFSSAARLKPNDAEIRNNLGAALLRAGRPAEALAAFEQALRLRPDYADARDNRELARASRPPPD